MEDWHCKIKKICEDKSLKKVKKVFIFFFFQKGKYYSSRALVSLFCKTQWSSTLPSASPDSWGMGSSRNQHYIMLLNINLRENRKIDNYNIYLLLLGWGDRRSQDYRRSILLFFFFFLAPPLPSSCIHTALHNWVSYSQLSDIPTKYRRVRCWVINKKIVSLVKGRWDVMKRGGL